MTNSINITNNPDQNRFEAEVNGHELELVYKIKDGKMYLLHTWVPEELEGHGYGTAIAEFALRYILNNGIKVVIICPFVRAYVKKHPNWREELA